ncbi:YbfA family protein [Entomohabitans teleogrylli]|uniref:YbfA family protein n=1 Tax=Entomohabitans teleogrylli TaxID=1384589 RepID=UPI00073DB1DD|nr:YbfA family protein [Entomohabitans teleogrylli]
MTMYKAYPGYQIFLRRAFVVVAGVGALPVMLFWKDRSRYYSYLHRVWSKTSNKPVWMEQAEQASGDFY